MKYKVILCEDELIISLDLKLAFKKSGFDVAGYFTSAEKALQYIKNSKPDVVITNVKLDGQIDGIELAKTLIEKYSVKVIIITGELLDFPIKNKNHFLQVKKPFTTEEIVEKTKALLKS